MFQIIDLFCGIGGFSYGFEMTGKFKTVLGVDLWDTALDTFKRNHPKTTTLNKKIEELDSDYWRKYESQIDVIIAGPPCQGFSMAGKRDVLDERNNLFKQVVRVASIIKPKIVVIENVVGLLSMRNEFEKSIKDEILRDFEQLGYKIDYQVLNAAEFGVPQARKRVIFIASNKSQVKFPHPTHRFDQFVTVGDALGNITNDEYYLEPQTDYQRIMSGEKRAYNHEIIKHSSLVTERMSTVPIGGNWMNIPKGLGQGGGVHSNNYKRLDPNKPSITIKHVSKSMIIHPYYDRTPTVREVARLQSFNDNFVLLGSKYDQHQQLANAVPPLLGRGIAHVVIELLEEK